MKVKGTLKLITKILLLAIVAALSYLVIFKSDYLLRKSFLLKYKTRGLLSAKLASDGVVLCTDLDHNFVFDYSDLSPVSCFGAKRIDSPKGHARDFTRKNACSLLFRKTYSCLPSSGASMLYRIKIKEDVKRQDLFNLNSSKGLFNLRVNNKKVEFLFNKGTELNNIISYDFTSVDKYITLGLVWDQDGVYMYEDGELKASADIPGDILFMNKRVLLTTDSNYPMVFELDDICFWNRPLSEKEISYYHSEGRSFVSKCKFFHYMLYDWSIKLDNFYRDVIRIGNRIVACSTSDAIFTASNIPVMNISMTKADEKHFLKAHEESLSSGFRTQKASSWRNVSLSKDYKTQKVELCLDDVYDYVDNTTRPAFMIKSEKDSSFKISRLYPPEYFSSFHMDALYVLPCDNYVRLYIDGAFKGLYCYEDFEIDGSSWKLYGENLAHNLPLHYDSIYTVKDGYVGLSEEAQGKLFHKMAKLVTSDVFFSWSKAEIDWRDYLHKENFQNRKFVGYKESAFTYKGENISPFFVYKDLDLGAAESNCVWESSNPNIISNEGRVFVDAVGQTPQDVVLKKTTKDGETKSFRFRVMPKKRTLPTLFINVARSPRKQTRTDFTAYFYEADDGLVPQELSGLGSTGGGLKHRGNTSYVKSCKRSMSLEFDRKVDFVYSKEVEHLLLLCGYADPTRLRNKFCYDLYSKMGECSDAPHPSVNVKWMEVFVNGDYYGVWEYCTRPIEVIHDCKFLYKLRNYDLLWGVPYINMVSCEYPKKGRNTVSEELRAIFEFVSSSSKKEFLANYEKYFYTDSVIDLFLLVNFSQNVDGRVTNHLIAKGEDDDRVFLMPWDYDKTFIGNKFIILTNTLYDKMGKNHKNGVFCQRWTHLRNTFLNEQYIDDWIEENSSIISSYMPWEYDLHTPDGFDGVYEDFVVDLKIKMKQNMYEMDKHFLITSN